MRTRLAALVILVAVAHAERPAAALDVSQVYEDVRDVIEDLVKADVARTISSKVEKEHPAVCYYFRGAFELMQSRDWGGVPGQLREGLIDASADFIIWRTDHVTSGTADVYSDLQEFVEERDDKLAAIANRRQPTEDACTEREWSQQATLLQTCSGLQTAGCLLGRLAYSLLHNHPSKATNDVRDFLITSVGGAHKDLVKLAVGGARDLHVNSNALSSAAKRLTGTEVCAFDLKTPPVESPCWHLDLAEQLKSLLVDIKVIDAGSVYTATVPALELPAVLSGRSMLPLVGGPAAPTDAQTLLSALRPGTCDATTLALRDPGGAPATAPFTTCWFPQTPPRLSIEYERWNQFLAAWPNADVAIQQDMQILRSLGWDGLTRVQTFREAVFALVRLEGSIDIFRASLASLEPIKQEVSFDDLLRTLVEVLCGPDRSTLFETSPGCAAGSPIKRIDELRASPTVQLFVRLVDTKNYRELAVAALRTLTTARSQVRDKINDVDSTLSGQEKRFLTAFATYVFDDASSSDARTLARQALRSAVQELLLETGHGFPTRTNRILRKSPCAGEILAVIGCKAAHVVEYPVYSLVPVLAVREESGDYWHDRSNDGLRHSLSLDMVSISAPLANYVGVRVSAIDLLAAPTEIALRDPTLAYAHRFRVLDETLRPRVDVWAGIPQLTRKVSLSVGAAVSFLQRDLSGDGRTVSYDFDVHRRHWALNFGLLIWL